MKRQKKRKRVKVGDLVRAPDGRRGQVSKIEASGQNSPIMATVDGPWGKKEYSPKDLEITLHVDEPDPLAMPVYAADISRR